MGKNFPEHWVETYLENIFSFIIGGDWGVDKSYNDNLVEVCVLRGNELSGRPIEEAARRFIKRSSLLKRQLSVGEIIIEISGGGPTQPVGRILYISEGIVHPNGLPLVCSNFFRKLKINKELSSKYIFYYMHYKWRQGDTEKYQNQTTGIRNLDFNRFIEETIIPLPPLNEQKRIVEKLDAILPKVKSAKAKLEKIPVILKKFRQSVLAAACSGRLTEDWREEYAQRTGKELPEWEEKKLNEIIYNIKYGYTSKSFSHGAMKYLRITDIQNGKVNWETVPFCQIEKNIIEKYLLEKKVT